MSEENTNWAYKPDSAATASSAGNRGAVSWEASEYIEHHHGAVWYSLLGVVTAALAAAIYFLSSRDAFAGGIIVALGIIVGVFAGHKPGIARYEVTAAGLKINEKLFRFGNYKSFAVIKEDSLSSLNLIPLKRFMPPIAAYFDPADEKKILEAVGSHLPYEQKKLDAIERLARRLRL